MAVVVLECGGEGGTVRAMIPLITAALFNPPAFICYSTSMCSKAPRIFSRAPLHIRNDVAFPPPTLTDFSEAICFAMFFGSSFVIAVFHIVSWCTASLALALWQPRFNRDVGFRPSVILPKIGSMMRT